MKLSKIVLYILIAVSVVVMGLFFFGGGTEQTLSDAADADMFYVPNYTSLAIDWASVLFTIAVVVAIFLGIWGFIQAPKQSVKSLFGIVALGVILLVCYFSADTTPIMLSNGKMFNDELGLILADVCIYSSAILFVLTLVSIALGWVMKLVK
ncbi:MAG: hypothetical protein KGV44_13230 [Flavobacteriaceae bacterium]|nr:hypothetical protein [Flavobacteriaceae bacterium]